MTLRLPPRREVAWAPPPHIFCELPRRRRPGRDAPPASGGGSGCKAAAGAPVGRRSGCGGAHDAASVSASVPSRSSRTSRSTQEGKQEITSASEKTRASTRWS
ncbi:unnamed protein product [Prorocentrum cordatum]|uniref:Uncharacterized protein n=1 Tax=Prorocentrum cordatum TaxID=2364126 RepID=A0ABN9SLX5_9DINO|nr:unnamed protein product [Polarella glacialis]